MGTDATHICPGGLRRNYAITAPSVGKTGWGHEDMVEVLGVLAQVKSFAHDRLTCCFFGGRYPAPTVGWFTMENLTKADDLGVPPV